MNRGPTNTMRVRGGLFSIAELGRVVDGLLNDVGDVTNSEGELGQTEKKDRLPPPPFSYLSYQSFFSLFKPRFDRSSLLSRLEEREGEG